MTLRWVVLAANRIDRNILETRFREFLRGFVLNRSVALSQEEVKWRVRVELTKLARLVVQERGGFAGFGAVWD